MKRKTLLFCLILSFIPVFGNVYSQDIDIQNLKKSKDPAPMQKKFPVNLRQSQTPLQSTAQTKFSSQESSILAQMEQLKLHGTSSADAEKILELQKQLEGTNGSTVTKQETNPIGKIIYPGPERDNLSSTTILTGDYMFACATQVEQRGTGAGKIWLAVGHGGLDTGAGASADTIVIFYTFDGGQTYTEYVKLAFSPANKIMFDDLDMEIIENTTGTKYIYLVFGYYTNGYLGERRIGYTVVSTPTLSAFGSSLSFPGQTPSSIFFNARITSDNANYPSVPYVNIVAMQDSIVGNDHYLMTKFCRILSPFTINPSITYFSHSIYSAVAGFIDYGVTTDIAYFNNTNDSLIFVLSGYPGYNQNIYTYKAYGNTSVYPVPSGILTPTGDNLEYARIASNGGSNMTRMIITYTDDYLNSGDYDLWFLSTSDANTWSAATLEYSSLHNSRYSDVIGKRNAHGSFAVAFNNTFGYLNNITACTFNDNFNLSTYVHCANDNYANAIANPKPSFRYQNNDSCLTFWAYFYEVYSTSGNDAINGYLYAAVEGYLDSVSNSSSIIDYFNIMLAQSTSPYTIVDTAGTYIDYQRLGNEYAFKNAPDGNYYIVLNHRNAIETWSANPMAFTHGYGQSYDFTPASSQSYGDNVVLKGTTWCLYSGDVNQDGTIDLSDITEIFNDATFFVLGHLLNTDLNGDNYVDVSDILLAQNNSQLFINKITP